jgi:hypothetical protein
LFPLGKNPPQYYLCSLTLTLALTQPKFTTPVFYLLLSHLRLAVRMSELREKREAELKERTAAFAFFTHNITRALSLGSKVCCCALSRRENGGHVPSQRLTMFQ